MAVVMPAVMAVVMPAVTAALQVLWARSDPRSKSVTIWGQSAGRAPGDRQ